MRILQIHTPYRDPGGEDRVVELETEVLRASGHEVHQHRVTNPIRTVDALKLLAAAPYNVEAKRRVVEVAQDFKPDIAHIHNTWFAQSPSLVFGLHELGIPIVATMHNYRPFCIGATLFRDGHDCTDCVGGSSLPGVIHGCYTSHARSLPAAATAGLHRRLGTWRQVVELILVPSPTAYEMFERDGFMAEQLRVKRNFTTDPGLRPAPPSTSSSFLFVGRLRPEKGPLALLDAWRRADLQDHELLIVGDGPLRPELEPRLPSNVRLLGWVDQSKVQSLMLSARALVFPSLWREPFGLTLIEAMAAGLPVLSFDVASAKEFLAAPPEMIVPKGDRKALAAGMRRLVDDRYVDELGAASRVRFLEAFSPGQSLAELEALYAEVIDSHRMGSADQKDRRH